MNSKPHGANDTDEAHQSLETADSVARATHLWVRSICHDKSESPSERLALAGGLINGLSEHLDLDPAIQALVAYVYTLLDDEGHLALCVSRIMLKRPAAAGERRAYERGRIEAVQIVKVLVQSQPGIAPADPSGPRAGPK
jgi:hypothetical protein